MKPSNQKTYVIGDVHGCYHTMIALIKKLPKDARIIFVGDLCDRGLYSKEVIEYIINNNHESTLGNHDYHFAKHIYEVLEGKTTRWNKTPQGGALATVQSYNHDRAALKRAIAWINTLPQYIEIDNYFISHAFALPYYQRRKKRASFKALLFNRLSTGLRDDYPWEEGWREYKVINIFGHDDYNEVQIGKNYYGIDTGCVYGRKLTAIELGTMQLIEQPLLEMDVNRSVF
jgi:serine/threonine protein phosphatase 1